jgi:hypothetical protein
MKSSLFGLGGVQDERSDENMTRTPKTPSTAERDGLGNDMSDRSTWTGGSESGETDTPIGHQHATWAQDPDDTEGVPTAEEVGRTGELETGTEFGADPSDDKSM